jgi:hypothetical protein
MESGPGLEKQISTPVEAEPFFLTSLFIELIEDSAAQSVIMLITTINTQVWNVAILRVRFSP